MFYGCLPIWKLSSIYPSRQTILNAHSTSINYFKQSDWCNICPNVYSRTSSMLMVQWEGPQWCESYKHHSVMVTLYTLWLLTENPGVRDRATVRSGGEYNIEMLKSIDIKMSPPVDYTQTWDYCDMWSSFVIHWDPAHYFLVSCRTMCMLIKKQDPFPSTQTFFSVFFIVVNSLISLVMREFII